MTERIKRCEWFRVDLLFGLFYLFTFTEAHHSRCSFATFNKRQTWTFYLVLYPAVGFSFRHFISSVIMGSVSSSAADPEYQEGKHTDMNRKEPKPGDLIEIFRVGYKHWGVYIGSGFVVHLVVNGLGSSSSCSLPAPGEMGFVIKEKLEDVVGGDKWRINNYLDNKYKPEQIYAIVKQAVGFIGTRLPYSLVSSNCEHFATDLRYGKPNSRQVVKVAAGIGGAVAGLALFTGGLVGILLGLSRR